jgi:hypothetical protein
MKYLIATLLVVVILTLSAVGYFIFQSHTEIHILARQDMGVTTPVSSAPTTQGVADQANATKTYTNAQFGFSFKYPSTWQITEDTLAQHGSVQITNYDPNAGGNPEAWRRGMNKIELNIVDDSYFTIDPGTQMSSTTVAGRSATKLVDTGNNIVAYLIPYMTGREISIAIYGDQTNFGILGDVLKSLTWSK